MNDKRNAVRRGIKLPFLMGLAITCALLVSAVSPIVAQAPAAPGAGARLDVADGTTASYRVQEQLAGINFPNEAVGTTSAVTGAIVLAPDGSVDTAKSKLTIDARTLK